MTLRVSQMSCERSNHLLFDPLSFDLSSGELLQVVGENGVGKTSLLRALVGILEPASGEVTWKNKPVHENWQDFFYLGHLPGVKQHLTVTENIMYQLRDSFCHEDQIKKTLRSLNVEMLANQRCQYLSAGQKQRVALAMMVLSRVQCWVLDEPFATLDEVGIDHVHTLFESHLDQGGTIILATHRLLHMPALPIKTLQLPDGCIQA